MPKKDCSSTWKNPTRNQWLGWREQVLQGYAHGRHSYDLITYLYYDVQLHWPGFKLLPLKLDI